MASPECVCAERVESFSPRCSGSLSQHIQTKATANAVSKNVCVCGYVTIVTALLTFVVFIFVYFLSLTTSTVVDGLKCYTLKIMDKEPFFCLPAVPKMYRTVTLKPKYMPNHEFCVPLHH